MPGGRPTKYRAKFHNEDFMRLSKQGKHIKQIALEWDVDRDTIYEWGRKHREFSVTLKKGHQAAEAWYMNIGQAAVVGRQLDKRNINLGFFVWMTKNNFDWSDKVEQKVQSTEEVSYKLNWADETDESRNPKTQK